MRNEEDGILLNAWQRRRVLLAVLVIETGRIALITGLAVLPLVLPPVPFCVAPFCAAVVLGAASLQRMREANRAGRRWIPDRGTAVSREDIRRAKEEEGWRTVVIPGAGRRGRTAVCVWTKAGRIVI